MTFVVSASSEIVAAGAPKDIGARSSYTAHFLKPVLARNILARRKKKRVEAPE
jgi:hypothetical protein